MPERKTAGVGCRRGVFRFREAAAAKEDEEEEEEVVWLLLLLRLLSVVRLLVLWPPLRGEEVAKRRGFVRLWRSDWCRSWSSPREGEDACRKGKKEKRKVSLFRFSKQCEGDSSRGSEKKKP